MKNQIKLINFNKTYITDKYISWLNDKNLMQYSEQRHHKHNKKTCLNYLKNFKSGGNLFFAIIDVNNNEHVGNLSIVIDKYNKLGYINILIGKPSKGYGVNTLITAIQLVKKKYNLRKLICGTMSNNLRMKNLLKKLKFKFYYSIKDYYLYKRREIDLDFYYIKLNK